MATKQDSLARDTALYFLVEAALIQVVGGIIIFAIVKSSPLIALLLGIGTSSFLVYRLFHHIEGMIERKVKLANRETHVPEREDDHSDDGGAAWDELEKRMNK